jgi:L-glutamine-phosphate cytidylyltransferase
MRLIVLAAGQGTRLGTLAAGRPKALVPLAGRPLLEWTLATADEVGLEVVVVGGHGIEHLAGYPVTLLENADYATTNMVETLVRAEAAFGDGFIASYGDIAYRPSVLGAILASPAPIAVAVDLDWRAYWEARFGDPLRDAESLRLRPDGTIASIGQAVERVEEIDGQYIGLVAFRGSGVAAFRATWQRAVADAAAGRPVLGRRADLRRLYMTDILDELAGTGIVHAVPIHGGWVEIDSPTDIALAESRWARSTPRVSPAGAA